MLNARLEVEDYWGGRKGREGLRASRLKPVGGDDLVGRRSFGESVGSFLQTVLV